MAKLVFENRDSGECLCIDVVEGACDPTQYGGNGNLYVLDGCEVAFTLSDLATLVRLLQGHEVPKISAMDWAQMQAADCVLRAPKGPDGDECL